MKKLFLLLPFVLAACYLGRWAEGERVDVEIPPRTIIVRYIEVEPKVYDVWARLSDTIFIYDPILDGRRLKEAANRVIGGLCEKFSYEVTNSADRMYDFYARYTCS